MNTPLAVRSSRSRGSVVAPIASMLGLALVVGGAFAQIEFTEHTLPPGYGTNTFVCAHDLDQDRAMDLIITDRLNDETVWLRNDGAQGFTAHPIPETNGYAIYPYVVDLDEDGDPDIVTGLNTPGEVRWWDNDGEESFTSRYIGAIVGAHRTIAVDLDQDDDLDVVGCGLNLGGNKWWENDGEEHFTEHVLATMKSSHCVAWADFDGDDDRDLVTTDFDYGIIWWENDGSETFTERSVGPLPTAHWVITEDLDGDGDSDIIAVGFNPSRVTWWQNDGSAGFTQHSVSSTFAAPLVVDAADIDRDGDVDLTVAGINENEISWWENDGSEDFTEHPLTDGTYPSAAAVCIEDLDGDGDRDIIGIGQLGPAVRWFENRQVDLGFDVSPCTGIAPFATEMLDATSTAFPITEWRWDCDDDGVVDAYGESADWTFMDPGLSSVRLEVVYDFGTGSLLRNNCVDAFDSSSALRFDGDEAHVVCAAAPDLNLTSELTVEAWIRPESWGGFPIGTWGLGQIIGKENIKLFLVGVHPVNGENTLCLKLEHEDGTSSTTCAPDSALVLGEWQHVAAAYDGATSTARLWIDGVEQSVAHPTAPSGPVAAHAAVDLMIGNSAALSWAFEGDIDEVRVWGRALETAEIVAGLDSPLSGDEPGLTAYWRMDEGNGGIVLDRTNSGHAGTLSGPAWVQGVVLLETSVPENPSGDETARRGVMSGYPNPFNPRTTIEFEMPREETVVIAVYDASGRRIRTLVDRRLGVGRHTVLWDGTDTRGRRVATGIYFCRLESAAGTNTLKLALVK